MAVTIAPLGGLTGILKIIRDADLDETAETNVADGAFTLHSIVADNAANGAASYLKAYNNAAPTVGTTAPDLVLLVPASKKRVYTFLGGAAMFTTACSLAAVTTAGTAGVTGPTSAMLVSVVGT